MQVPDITVLISTRNRAESLRRTLSLLEAADRRELRCEVVVIDNAGSEQTKSVVLDGRWTIKVHLVVELVPGKARALNRALATVPMGQIVAVLDDDMSPDPGWFQGIARICGRWPDKGWFTGRSYVIWPREDVPAWCRRPAFAGWAYSVQDPGQRDRVCAVGRWYSGNHFWFRSAVLSTGLRFNENLDLRRYLDVTQAQFMLDLAERGIGGVSGPDAVCGHRIQEDLLDKHVIRSRAVKTGRGFAIARLQPPRQSVKQSSLFAAHPVLARAYCNASVVGWALAAAGTRPLIAWHSGMEQHCHAVIRLATYLEYLRVARITGH